MAQMSAARRAVAGMLYPTCLSVSGPTACVQINLSCASSRSQREAPSLLGSALHLPEDGDEQRVEVEGRVKRLPQVGRRRAKGWGSCWAMMRTFRYRKTFYGERRLYRWALASQLLSLIRRIGSERYGGGAVPPRD